MAEPTTWDDDLIWCPSQCYLDVTFDDGTPAILYLRWRHDDPWTGHIITGFHHTGWRWAQEGAWSENLIGFFRAQQLDEAKAALEAEFTKRNALSTA